MRLEGKIALVTGCLLYTSGYLAAVAANLVWGKTLREATEWASKYAAYKVTRKGSMTRKPGCGYPEMPEIEEFMRQHP